MFIYICTVLRFIYIGVVHDRIMYKIDLATWILKKKITTLPRKAFYILSIIVVVPPCWEILKFRIF